MKLDFSQGIVTYPIIGNQQYFLSKTGSYVSLITANGRTDVVFADGNKNYLLTEASDVNNAWGPLLPNTDYWLYWDIDSRTAVRTFGVTTLQPYYSDIAPTSPSANQHWFDTFNKQMFVFSSGNWRKVIRVFAAKINNSNFQPLGTNTIVPFAGSQGGIISPDITAGRILVDDTGAPVRRPTGQFFTTEDEFFVNGSPISAMNIDSSVVIVTALTDPIAKFEIVRFVEFGRVVLATYEDVGHATIAIAMEDILGDGVGSVSYQGLITNPNWNFATVGALVWVNNVGQLVDTDPHITNPILHLESRPPIGRVTSATSIIFEQGFAQGVPGPVGTPLTATNAILGISRLSLPAIDPLRPIVVGDNDPRLTNVNLATQQYAVAKAGDTMTGSLILNGDPTLNLHAATKHYVDGLTDIINNDIAIIVANRVNKAGDTMTGLLVLSGDPIVPLGAATKQYVDTKPSALSALTDVILSNVQPNDGLYYNGTNWQNTPLPTRKLATYTTTVALPLLSFEDFVIEMGGIVTLLSVHLSVGGYQIQGYSTSSRTDSNPYTFVSATTHLTDDGSTILSDGSVVYGRRYTILSNLENTPSKNIYWRLTNTALTAQACTVTFIYFSME